MSLVQHITIDIGGIASIEPLTRPACATATVYSSDGVIVCANSNANISTINTVLTAAAAKRAKIVTVNSNTGFSQGEKFCISSPTEWAKCKLVNGNAIHIYSPLREDHANASTVYSTKTSATIPAANASTLFFDGRVRWEIDNGASIQWSGLECTRYPLNRVCTEQDLYEVNPGFYALLSAEEDIDTALDAAHEHVLGMLSARGRARVYPASTEFTRAVALAFARNHYRHQASDSAKVLFDRYSAELSDEMSKMENALGADEDQDGDITEGEQRSSRSFRMIR